MLKARVVTALLLVAGLLAVLLLLPGMAAAGLFAAVAALAGWEWSGLLRARQSLRLAFAALIMFACLLAWAVRDVSFPLIMAIATVFWIAVVPFWLNRRWQLGGTGHLLGLLVLLAAWVGLVSLHQRSPSLLLAVMAMVWIADIGAYFAGRAFGRHKLAPAISPGKTWEGVGGAVAGVLLYGMVATLFLPLLSEVPRRWLAAFLLLLTAFSIVGDLFESMIKRQAGMKDSSQLLPGHGGVLDRVDSLLPTLPLSALSLYWLEH